MPELVRISVMVAGLVAAAPDARSAAPGPLLVADRGAMRLAEVQPGTDPWLGADKFRHLWMSYAATTFAFAVARGAGADSGAALQVAVPVSAAAGIAKEIHDRRSGGVFSLRDLAANALGIAAGYFLLREVR